MNEFVKCRKAAGERINSDQQTAKHHLAGRGEKRTPVREQTKHNDVEFGAGKDPPEVGCRSYPRADAEWRPPGEVSS